MQQKIRKHAHLLKFSLLFSCISSVSLLMCAFVVDSGSTVALFAIPFVFWFSLIAEQVLFWKANSLLKLIVRTGKVRKLKTRPGIIAPFQTKTGAIADLVFIVSLVLLVISMIGEWGESLVQFILLFLIVLSFRIHCIVNGRNYWYKKYLAKRKVD